MSDREDLSRLLDGALAPADEAELRARITRTAALAEDWARLQRLPDAFEALLTTPPPPGLDDAVLARATRRPVLPRVLPWVLMALAAAAVVLMLARPRPAHEVVVPEGTVRVDGRVRLLAGAVAVTIDGITEVTVEPAQGHERGTGAGGTMNRRLLAVVVITVAEGTAVVHAGDTAPIVLGAGESTRIGPAPASVPPVAPAADEARIRELEAQNAVLQRLLEDADVEAHGTPIPWPPGLPRAFTPAGFERQVREAVAECAPEVEIVGFECSEPPCFALLRAPGAKKDDPYGTWWDRLINECPAWTEFYTNGVVGGSGEATCPDGSTERYNAWGWSPDLVAPPVEPSAEEKENASKRFRTRMEEIQRSWPCTGG